VPKGASYEVELCRRGRLAIGIWKVWWIDDAALHRKSRPGAQR
jgi:hypothetical protein